MREVAMEADDSIAATRYKRISNPAVEVLEV
jgi:hypothetical protein